MKLRGFTIVELIIIITIMGILLTLGVVNLSSSQASARDAERKGDLEGIAMYLETFYTSGSDNSLSRGRYPSIADMNSYDKQIKTLRDIDPRLLRAPGLNGSNNITSLTASPPNYNTREYFYTPMTSLPDLCETVDEICTHFILTSYGETNPIGITVSSKNQ